MKTKTENIKNHGKMSSGFPLDQCVIADHPEMARNSNDDEPCNDNRSKQ